jgi:hypothetical protein
MATDWAAEQLDAYNDIKDEGVAIRIVKTTAGTYHPVTDAVSGGGTTGYATYAINTKFKDSYDSEVHMNESNETPVKRGDRMLLIPAYGLPDLSNAGSLDDYEIQYGGYNNNFVFTESIEPGGVAILFKAAIRRNAKL